MGPALVRVRERVPVLFRLQAVGCRLRRVSTPSLRVALGILLLVLVGRTTLTETPVSAQATPRTYRYHPKFRVPPSLELVQQHLTAGLDEFPEEKLAEELAARLAELGAALRQPPAQRSGAVDRVLASAFNGASLTPADATSLGADPRLEIARSRSMPTQATLTGAGFHRELTAFLSVFEAIQTAEFLITAIEVPREPSAGVRTTVRYDLVGTNGRGRAERLGHWQMRWQRGHDNVWRIVEWTALDDLRSRATVPIFSEVTGAAFGGLPSFREQLVPGLDYWASRMDGVFTPRGMGHHGVSVGDIDGDGLDDAVRVAAGWPDEPPVSQQGRRHVRGRDRGRGSRRARSHVAVDLRRRRQRRRPGPDSAHTHRADAVRRTTARPCSRATATRSSSGVRCRAR